MSDVLAWAETRAEELRPVSRECVTAACSLADGLGGSADVLVVGPPGISDPAAGLGRFGARRVFVAEHEEFATYCPDATLRILEELVEAEEYAAVVFPATARGKDLSPRAAARLGRSLATEVTELRAEEGAVVAVRPVYAGKALATVRLGRPPALASVRPNVFLPEEREDRGEVVAIEGEPEPARQRFLPVETGERDRLDVAEAPIVVSGGRGMQDPENWPLLEELAEALGSKAALGASRAVVDAGWRPHAEQVGQTGKVVSPNLYFAIGISGAIQHLAGMRTSKVIVAVNKDPEAPIFDVADYGIVGDLFEVVPRLTEEIRKVREDGA